MKRGTDCRIKQAQGWYLFHGPIVLGVPEFNISIGSATCQQGTGCSGGKGEGIDSRRHIVNKPAPVDFHGSEVVKKKEAEEKKEERGERTLDSKIQGLN